MGNGEGWGTNMASLNGKESSLGLHNGSDYTCGACIMYSVRVNVHTSLLCTMGIGYVCTCLCIG